MCFSSLSPRERLIASGFQFNKGMIEHFCDLNWSHNIFQLLHYLCFLCKNTFTVPVQRLTLHCGWNYQVGNLCTLCQESPQTQSQPCLGHTQPHWTLWGILLNKHEPRLNCISTEKIPTAWKIHSHTEHTTHGTMCCNPPLWRKCNCGNWNKRHAMIDIWRQ